MKWYFSYKNHNWCLWFDHAIVHNTWQLVVTKWHTCILQQTLLRLVHKKWGNNTLPAVTNHIWTENKKTQHIYDTTSNRNSIESSRPLPTCGKNREGPISKFRLTNIHADNPKFSFYQLKLNQSSDVSPIISWT